MKIIKILLFEVIISVFLFPQSIQQKLGMLRELKNTEFSTVVLESERDRKISEITTEEKGEFETTAMYQKRLREAKNLFDQRQSEIDIEIQELLFSSREGASSSFRLGKYDADRGEFPITLNKTGQRFEVEVPFSFAKDFKENHQQLQATGNRKLTLDGDWDYFNWKVHHPYSGQTYIFGPQEASVLTSIPSQKATRKITPPNLSAQIAFTEPSGDDRLDAEETAELIVSVKNSGKGSAKGVEIVTSISGTASIDYPKSIYIGEIPAGSIKTKRIKLKAGDDISTGVVNCNVSFKELNGFTPDDIIIKFETEALIPPKLQIVDIGVDDANGNSKIEPGEVVAITVRVQNLGHGSADDVRAKANLGSTDIFFMGGSQERFSLGSLSPGEYKDFTIELVSNKRAKAMPISVDLTESRGKFGLHNHSLNLSFNKITRSARELVIAGKQEEFKEIEIAAGLSIDIEKDIPKTITQNSDALAIIFGIEHYKNVTGVTFAKRDAELVKDYFNKVLGIPLHRIYYQVGSDASKAEFDKVFSKDGWLDKRVKKDKTDIYFYYSGHGAPDIKSNRAYLIPYDGDPNYPSQTGYSLDQLYDNLSNLNARSINIFLDACFSGANRESEMLLADARPIFIEVLGPTALGNITVFSASSGNEISSAWPEKKHGLFTYFFLKGLKGNADSNRDKVLTIHELSDYIKTNVSETAGFLDREQTPGIQTRDKNVILVRY